MAQECIAFALAGAIGDLRLPLDLCWRIATLVGPVVSQRCHECGVPLLEATLSMPMVRKLPTHWMLDARGCWLFTDRGSLLSEAPTDPPDLVLTGTEGCVTPDTTPYTIHVHVDDEVHAFRNRTHRLDQLRWYRVIDQTFLCRQCTLSVRRRRIWFGAWKQAD